MKNKIAVVTGSTKGIGRQIGLSLLQKDYFVYFNYANDVESAQELQDDLDLSGYSDKFVILQGDLSTYKGTQDFLDKINGNLDCIVFNVGISDKTEWGNININDWEKVFRTNLSIPFFMLQVLKDRINDNGRIIFISSILAEKPHARSISYAISKAGINSLVINLVKHFTDKNITVNAISAGFVNTDWHLSKTKEQLQKIKEKIALKRFAEPEEIAHLVIEIVENNYINGSILKIDGGYDYE